MPVKIRLTRMGKKKQPTYRVVVMDSRKPRDGAYIEQIGRYDPRQEPSLVEIDNDKALHWLEQGAQPTDRARKLLEISGAWTRFRVAKGDIHTIGTTPAPAAATPAPEPAAAEPESVEAAAPMESDPVVATPEPVAAVEEAAEDIEAGVTEEVATEVPDTIPEVSDVVEEAEEVTEPVIEAAEAATEDAGSEEEEQA